MGTFSQFPNEMITEIWEYVSEPKDVENFALVSKRIYAMGAPFVDEHNKLKRNYSSSNILVFEGPDAGSSVWLLKKILLWPRVALYVTHLSTYQYWAGWAEPPNSDDDDRIESSWSYFIDYSDDDIELFIEAIRRPDLVLQNEVEDWITAVKEGNDDPIVVLLLLLLPNLNTMTLVVHSGFCRLAKTLRRISETKNSPFLRRLTTVNLEARVVSEDNFMDWKWLSTSAALPLVQSLNVVRTGVDDENVFRNRQRLEPGSSTVKKLALAKSRNCPKSIFHLFENFKGLKTFTYSNEDEGAEPFEPYWMGNAIVTYAKHSIESLKITAERREYAKAKTLGSFRDCKNLREMEINIHMLWGNFPLRTLPDLFPMSIEKIHLHPGDLRYTQIPSSIVDVFVEAKSQLLPSLRVLIMELELRAIMWEEDKAVMMASKNKCGDVGIELSVIVLK